MAGAASVLLQSSPSPSRLSLCSTCALQHGGGKKKSENEGKGNLGRCTLLLLLRMASAEDLQKERSSLIFRKLFFPDAFRNACVT